MKKHFDRICDKYAQDTKRIADNWIVRTKKGMYGSIMVPKTPTKNMVKKQKHEIGGFSSSSLSSSSRDPGAHNAKGGLRGSVAGKLYHYDHSKSGQVIKDIGLFP
jgi:hypothetical protein